MMLSLSMLVLELEVKGSKGMEKEEMTHSYQLNHNETFLPKKKKKKHNETKFIIKTLGNLST